jgi:hypothetical protein
VLTTFLYSKKYLKTEIGTTFEIFSACHAKGVSNIKLSKCWDCQVIGQVMVLWITGSMCSTTFDWEYERWRIADVLFTVLFISSQDVDHLASQLPNLLGKFLVPLPAFNHLDFLWAIDGDTLVYNKVISQMNSL